MTTKNKLLVFISYSHKDSDWLERLQIHLKPLSRNYDVEPWDDTKIKHGSDWKEKIKIAIEKSSVAIMLISADFLASDFINENELPPLLENAKEKGTLIIPIIISPSFIHRIDSLNKFLAVNDYSKPLISLEKHEQESILVQVAEDIYYKLEEYKVSPVLDNKTKPISNENFLEKSCWEKLIKIGSWHTEPDLKYFRGSDVKSYILSNNEYGEKDYKIETTISFNRLKQFTNKPNFINAGIVFSFNLDGPNPKYYNILFKGDRVLLEKIGFNNGTLFEDYEHFDDGVSLSIVEGKQYFISLSFENSSLLINIDGKLLKTYSLPEMIKGRVGIRPMRSTIICSDFKTTILE